MEKLTDTAWIEPGAKVVVWTDRHGSTRWTTQSVTVQTIERVNKKSFTTTSGGRFSLDTGTYRGVGNWPLTHYCRPPWDAAAQRALAELRTRNAETSIHNAFAAWSSDPTDDTLQALIDAAQKALETGEGT